MLAALRDTGWHDYSLFLREDGLLVGYLLTDDFDAALSMMDVTEVNARWQAEIAEFFVASSARAEPPPGETREAQSSWRPDRHMHVLTEVFNLDDQLGDVR